jgi:hypothetical protein
VRRRTGTCIQATRDKSDVLRHIVKNVSKRLVRFIWSAGLAVPLKIFFSPFILLHHEYIVLTLEQQGRFPQILVIMLSYKRCYLAKQIVVTGTKPKTRMRVLCTCTDSLCAHSYKLTHVWAEHVLPTQ